MTRPVELESRCGDCLLYGAIQGLADAVALVDLEGRIFSLNRRAHEILDIGSRHVLGTPLADSLHHAGLADFWAAATKELVPVATDLELPDGGSLRVTVSLCLSATREPIGRAIILRDVTREKRLQVELSSAVAKRLVEMAAIGRVAEELLVLTTREREVLALLSQGLTNGQIAHKLHVSAHTVASHLKNMYPKLKVANRAQAAATAVRHGVHPPGG